ncbi:MAG: zinc ribbon domain-containing protein [Patescibacteria group bacterium]
MFAFTRIMVCGQCGFGITAEDKIKKLLSGEIRRHVYYHCTGGVRGGCKQPWIKEPELIDQFVEILDKLDIDSIGMKEKLQEEIDRYNRFTTGVLGLNSEANKMPRVDLKMYAKYILREGSHEEKREILKNIKNKVALKDGKLELQTTSI